MRRTSILIWALAASLTACADESQDETETPPTKPPDLIDLAVDASRDGVVNLDDPNDQDHELEFSATYGAAFLANLDDDDGDHIEDYVDQIVNGDADALDLARIKVRPWAAAPAGTTAKLTVDGVGVGHVRIYRLREGTGWELVAGAVGPCGQGADMTCNFVASYELKAEDLAKGVEFGIEALHFAGGPEARRVHNNWGLVAPNPQCTDPNRPVSLKDNCQWSGMVQVELQGFNAQGAPILTDTNPTDGIDKAILRASPWMANHNLRKFDKVYFHTFSDALVSTLTPALQQSNVAAINYAPYGNDSGGDIWYEDWMQTGTAAMPGPNGLQGYIVFNPRPWGRPPGNPPYTATTVIQYNPVTFLRKSMLGPDSAVAVFWDEGAPNLTPDERVTVTDMDKGDSFDSHGNHDALPPSADAPVGRILTGSAILQSTRDFYSSQAQPYIQVDTSWLAVGHIDEVASPVAANTERGWKVLINTPALGRQMFQDFEAQGQGAAVVFSGKGSQWQTTVAETNADTVMMTWNQESQVRVDAIHDQLISDAGLTEADFVQVPVLYEDIGGKIAWLPDTANVRIIDNGNTGIFATTQGPLINGNDAMKTWLETNIGTPMNGLGADGQGLDVRFGDSWEYHVLLGDIHCASNWTGPPLVEEPMWWSSVAQ